MHQARFIHLLGSYLSRQPKLTDPNRSQNYYLNLSLQSSLSPSQMLMWIQRLSSQGKTQLIMLKISLPGQSVLIRRHRTYPMYIYLSLRNPILQRLLDSRYRKSHGIKIKIWTSHCWKGNSPSKLSTVAAKSSDSPAKFRTGQHTMWRAESRERIANEDKQLDSNKQLTNVRVNSGSSTVNITKSRTEQGK